MSTNIQTNNTLASQSSLKECVQQNYNDHKVEVLGSGLSTGALAGGIVTASLLGGPIGLIIGLAAASLLALGLFLKTLFAQPQNVTVEPQSQPSDKQPTPVAIALKAPQNQPVAKTPVVELTQGQATPESLSQRVKNAFTSAGTYATEHPYKTAAGAALVAAAGYGIYAAYYSAYAAATPSLLMIDAPALLIRGPNQSATSTYPLLLASNVFNAQQTARVKPRNPLSLCTLLPGLCQVARPQNPNVKPVVPKLANLSQLGAYSNIRGKTTCASLNLSTVGRFSQI